MKKSMFFLIAVLNTFLIHAQQITWTGNANDNDFFNEQNWEDDSTNASPASGTIDPFQSIDSDLLIQNTTQIIVANGVINLGTGSLSISDSMLTADAFSGGSIEINNEAYVDLEDPNPFQNNTMVNLMSGIGWIRTLNLKGNEVQTNYINQIQINSQASVYQTNLRLDNYYLNGTVIRSNDLSSEALIIYNETNLQGSSTGLSLDVVHSGASIANNMDNQAESFVLKKGYTATFADNQDGTGKSKNYIASEEDLVINELPSYLANTVSFIRVIPWNWVNKKGRTGTDTELNNTWYYLWGNIGDSSLDLEYAPMSWGYGGANDDSDIDNYKSKYKSTHVMAFNEADNCNDQSGQYNNLCDTDVAVDIYKNLMKTGLRLVSPSCRENAPFGWLKEFHDKANLQDIRIDVIALHWYDWGSNPANSPNANPQDVFNRFVTYLENVHNLYGLPIWITEFNANPNRTNATNYGFMQLALPYLESLDYVERYVWYQPNSGVADYYDASGTNLTNVGTFYQNQVSSVSIPEATLFEDSNLDIYYNTFGPSDNLLVNGYFETQDLTGWTGNNLGTLSNSNVYAGSTTGRILANAGTLEQTVTLESLESYNLFFYTKWFVTPSAPIAIQILDANTNAVIASQVMTTSTNWNLVELNFTVPTGVTDVKFYVTKGASTPGWFIDNALLLKSQEVLATNDFEVETLQIYPNPSKGLFTIKSKSSLQSYSIYNIKGQLLKNKTNLNSTEVKINLEVNSKGMYYLVVKDNSGNQTTKKLILN